LLKIICEGIKLKNIMHALPMIQAWIVDFVLVFTFHYEMTTKAKSIFYTKKNGDKNDEA